jgi:hypothetical protein
VLDIGTVVNGFVIDDVAFDKPNSWWCTCGHGHARIFATTAMLEAGEVKCNECANAAKIKADTLAALFHARNVRTTQ